MIRSRVVVKSDVTLESTDGPENTIIRGAAATEPDAIGCGADAIRCAYVKNRGVISGFTLTGGHTKGKADGQHYRDDWSAGGVLGQSESATVRNCIIRQNSAFRGGGARYILMDTCQVIDNTAGANSPAVGESKCVNTLFKDNWGLAQLLCLYTLRLHVPWLLERRGEDTDNTCVLCRHWGIRRQDFRPMGEYCH